MSYLHYFQLTTSCLEQGVLLFLISPPEYLRDLIFDGPPHSRWSMHTRWSAHFQWLTYSLGACSQRPSWLLMVARGSLLGRRGFRRYRWLGAKFRVGGGWVRPTGQVLRPQWANPRSAASDSSRQGGHTHGFSNFGPRWTWSDYRTILDPLFATGKSELYRCALSTLSLKLGSMFNLKWERFKAVPRGKCYNVNDDGKLNYSIS